jgi:asparagine synthase (glutamine-hydrolysing)
VPVGIFLSGGLDSTALLALASQTQSESLQTYSIVFEDESFNEGAIAAQTAKHFQTQHHEYCLTPELGQTIFQQYLDSLDQPTIDGFNTFTVAQLAANNGTKVVLSGLGGDELFGGYGSFSVIPKMLRWRSHLQAFTPISQLFGKVLSQTTIVDSKIKRLGDFLQAPSTSQSAYQCMRGIFSQQEALTLTQFYCPDWQYQPLNFLQNPQDSFSCPTISDEISWLELSQYMRNQLLRDSDVMSMRQGLELRVPFVDQVLLEAIAPIPSQWRLAQGKQILKEAIPEIPPWVLNHPKKGFMFPLQKWFDKSWVQTFTDLSFVPKSINLNLWYRRLAVINLNYWLYILN